MKNIEVYRALRCQSQTNLPPTRWKTIQVKVKQASMSQALIKKMIKELFFNQSHVQDVFQSMFMPYIENPKMDLTVNNGLYHRFLKWRMECENMLEFKLAILVDRRKYKKVIAWSGDFGIDQYEFWNLTNKELTPDVIWEKFEEFCKSQSNEVRTSSDFLTSFRHRERSVNEW